MPNFTIRNPASSALHYYASTGSGTQDDPFVPIMNGNGTPAELSNFGFELAKGNIPGHTTGTVFGHMPDLELSVPAMIWDYGINQPIEVLLTADTEIFISSSSASDVNVGLLIEGATEGYIKKEEFHLFTSGLLQQSIGNWFRITNITVISGTSPVGAIYCAESDTLSAGAPTTPALVHAYMTVGSGTTHKASGVVFAGHSLYINWMFIGAGKGSDCILGLYVKADTAPGFTEVLDFPLYQNTTFEDANPPFKIAEKSDFQFIATTKTNNSHVSVNFNYTLVDEAI